MSFEAHLFLYSRIHIYGMKIVFIEKFKKYLSLILEKRK